MKRPVALFVIAFSLMAAPASALDPMKVAPAVSKYVAAPALANPSVSIVDLTTGEIVYSHASLQQRKPASTLKLMSAIAAYTYIKPTTTFTTSVHMGKQGKSIVIQGSYDPWFSYKEPEGTLMSRTSVPKIGFNAIAAVKGAYKGSARNLTIYYSNLWPRDLANFRVFFKHRGLVPTFKRVSTDEAISMSGDYIRSSTSPDVRTMVNWALTWSDNDVATNLAKIASAKAGNGLTSAGIDKTFHSILSSSGIDATTFHVVDGSGVSDENFVSADLMMKVLLKLHADPELSPIMVGLPISGETGTLRKRFVDTAPSAVGLVKAKTGTLRHTVSLAGFVESGDREYAFVVIADNVRSGYQSRARETVDRLLGRLAQPISYMKQTTVADSATVVSN